jgi:hypothetical protein
MSLLSWPAVLRQARNAAYTVGTDLHGGTATLTRGLVPCSRWRLPEHSSDFVLGIEAHAHLPALWVLLPRSVAGAT